MNFQTKKVPLGSDYSNVIKKEYGGGGGSLNASSSFIGNNGLSPLLMYNNAPVGNLDLEDFASLALERFSCNFNFFLNRFLKRKERERKIFIF